MEKNFYSDNKINRGNKGMTPLERENIFLELEENIRELLEMFDDNEISSCDDENLLQIKEHLDTMMEIILENL
jgi:regulator of sigma D